MSVLNQLPHASVWFMTAAVIVNDFLLLGGSIHERGRYNSEPGVSWLLTESQNSRGWKGPLWVIQSNPLPKQGHPEQAAQDLVQPGLEYLQRRRLHHLPGQPVPVLRQPQSEEALPRVQVELTELSVNFSEKSSFQGILVPFVAASEGITTDLAIP